MNYPRDKDELAWIRELREGFSDPVTLLSQLSIKPEQLAAQIDEDSTFPMRVPRAFVERMASGDPKDPLLLQVLPLLKETRESEGFVPDPLMEKVNTEGSIIHKYAGRALLIAAGTCAINCRYCFRREFPYGDHVATRSLLKRAASYLKTRPEVSEVILSGGDPFLLTNDRIEMVLRMLAQVPHIETIRIHSRVPIVLPSRITDGLIQLLLKFKPARIIVIHANHPNELDSSVKQAIARLREANIHILNQAVLLRDVNDLAAIQVALCKRLWAIGILPYYLHVLDRVTGTAHFDVPVSDIEAISKALLTELPGYLVPRIVKDVPGAPFKVPFLIADDEFTPYAKQ